MTDFQNLLFEKKNQIAYITLNRPKVLNALNMATMEELRQAFAAVKDDAEVRVVILTGSGEKAFVAGADIGDIYLGKIDRHYCPLCTIIFYTYFQYVIPRL